MSTYDNGSIKSCYGSSYVSTSHLLVNGFVANSFEYGYAEIGLPDFERNAFWDVCHQVIVVSEKELNSRILLCTSNLKAEMVIHRKLHATGELQNGIKPMVRCRYGISVTGCPYGCYRFS